MTSRATRDNKSTSYQNSRDLDAMDDTGSVNSDEQQYQNNTYQLSEIHGVRPSSNSSLLNTLPTCAEPRKAALSSSPYSVLTWHIGTAVSIPVTILLVSLNVKEQRLSSSLASTPTATANIVAALQVAAKFHELMIVLSLVNITRQWTQRTLLNRNGTFLGLIGAELSIMDAGYLVSDGYLAAVKLGLLGLFHGLGTKHSTRTRSPRQRLNDRPIFFLVIFLPIACLLCLLAGPATAILIIPRQDWFLVERMNITNYLPPEYHNYLNITNYPSILLDPRYTRGDRLYGVVVGYQHYWVDLWANLTKSTNFLDENAELSHFSPTLGVAALNSSTTWGRPLTLGAEWNGRSTLKGIMQDDLGIYRDAWRSLRVTEPDMLKKSATSKMKGVAEMTGLEMDIVCRLRNKDKCNPVGSHEWCYAAVSQNSSADGPLRNNDDLLLISDHTPFSYTLSNQDDISLEYILPRLYITEGSRLEDNTNYADSIAFVFEKPNSTSLIVCVSNSTLKAATTTVNNLGMIYDIKAHFHDYLSYFNNSTTSYKPPRGILYHENWLDILHGCDNSQKSGVIGTAPWIQTTNRSSRFSRGKTCNQELYDWGANVVKTQQSIGAPIWESRGDWANHTTPYWYDSLFWPSNDPALSPWSHIEAGMVEIAIGGSWFSMLLSIPRRATQYDIPKSGDIRPTFPKESYLEPPQDYSPSFYVPISLYLFVHGYRISTRTDISAAVILLLHTFIALVGSLWQLRQRGLIVGWNSIPEYITLCLASQPLTEGIQNTSAGIHKYETLQRRIRIGETTKQNLEIAIIPGNGDTSMTDVQKQKKY